MDRGLDLIAGGSAVTLTRSALEPVVRAMVVSWLPRTQPAWAKPAKLVIAKLLDWLEDGPGNDWQARWIASGADAYPRTWMTNAEIEGPLRHELASLTINALIILRAIVPTLDWLTGIPRLRLTFASQQSIGGGRCHRDGLIEGCRITRSGHAECATQLFVEIVEPGHHLAGVHHDSPGCAVAMPA